MFKKKGGKEELRMYLNDDCRQNIAFKRKKTQKFERECVSFCVKFTSGYLNYTL